MRHARSSRCARGAPARRCVDGVTGVLVDGRGRRQRFAEALARVRGAVVRPRRHPGERRAVLARALPDRLPGCGCPTPIALSGAVSHDAAVQPPARRVLRRERRGAGAWPRSSSPTSSGSTSSPTLVPGHQRRPAVRAVPRHAAVHRPASCRSRSTCRASTGCAAAARASTISSRSSSARSWRSILGLFGTLYFQAYYAARRAEGRRRLRGLAARLGALPDHQRRLRVHARASSSARRSSGGGRRASA